jgi:hypothetical protein
MSHSKNFDLVKKYYTTIYEGKRVWDETRVKATVGKKSGITAEEYEEIVGQKYEA